MVLGKQTPTNPEHVSCRGAVKALPQIAKAKHSPWGRGFVPQSPHMRVLCLAGVGMWESPELLEVQEGHTRPLGSSRPSATIPLPPPRAAHFTPHPTLGDHGAVLPPCSPPTPSHPLPSCPHGVLSATGTLGPPSSPRGPAAPTHQAGCCSPAPGTAPRR